MCPGLLISVSGTNSHYTAQTSLKCLGSRTLLPQLSKQWGIRCGYPSGSVLSCILCCWRSHLGPHLSDMHCSSKLLSQPTRCPYFVSTKPRPYHKSWKVQRLANSITTQNTRVWQTAQWERLLPPGLTMSLWFPEPCEAGRRENRLPKCLRQTCSHTDKESGEDKTKEKDKTTLRYYNHVRSTRIKAGQQQFHLTVNYGQRKP